MHPRLNRWNNYKTPPTSPSLGARSAGGVYPDRVGAPGAFPSSTSPAYTEMHLPTQSKLCNVSGGALSQDCQQGIS